MGVIKFTMPPNLPLEDTQELERAAFRGGPDGMPYTTQVLCEPSFLTIFRDLDESGHLTVPWHTSAGGRLIATTATLIERGEPYDLLIELARGAVNTLRNQSQDWLLAGLNMPVALAHRIREASVAFCRALGRLGTDEAHKYAQTSLILASEASDELIHAYMNQVFQVRQQNSTRQQGTPKLDTVLGCSIGPTLPYGENETALLKACNGFNIPFAMKMCALTEGDYHFEIYEPALQWARTQNTPLWGGPLVDFSPSQIPSWLWLWERDRNRIAKLLCEYTAETIRHYQDQISTWQLTSAANIPGVLSLQDDELLWLVLQMGEAARRVNSDCELMVGVSQPWGEYMTDRERSYSPFVFVDTLLRSGLSLSAINIEVVMGVSPRGSYCRDLMDFSRMLDLYALLGVPLQVTLGYPASTAEDLHADSQLSPNAGHWREEISAQNQADWASEFAALALCKPYVRAVQWVQFSDQEPHLFPNCGLVDAKGTSRPVLHRLKRLRDKYLR